MAEEGKTYICEGCGSEVKVIKRMLSYPTASSTSVKFTATKPHI